MTFASFEGRKMLANVPFYQTCFRGCFFYTSVLASPDPLQTAFELTSALPTAKNQPDATALTENLINWLARPKHIKIFFEHFQFLQNSKVANLGGLIYFDISV